MITYFKDASEKSKKDTLKLCYTVTTIGLTKIKIPMSNAI